MRYPPPHIKSKPGSHAIAPNTCSREEYRDQVRGRRNRQINVDEVMFDSFGFTHDLYADIIAKNQEKRERKRLKKLGFSDVDIEVLKLLDI